MIANMLSFLFLRPRVIGLLAGICTGVGVLSFDLFWKQEGFQSFQDRMIAVLAIIMTLQALFLSLIPTFSRTLQLIEKQDISSKFHRRLRCLIRTTFIVLVAGVLISICYDSLGSEPILFGRSIQNLTESLFSGLCIYVLFDNYAVVRMLLTFIQREARESALQKQKARHKIDAIEILSNQRQED